MLKIPIPLVFELYFDLGFASSQIKLKLSAAYSLLKPIQLTMVNARNSFLVFTSTHIISKWLSLIWPA